MLALLVSLCPPLIDNAHTSVSVPSKQCPALLRRFALHGVADGRFFWPDGDRSRTLPPALYAREHCRSWLLRRAIWWLRSSARWAPDPSTPSIAEHWRSASDHQSRRPPSSRSTGSRRAAPSGLRSPARTPIHLPHFRAARPVHR